MLVIFHSTALLNLRENSLTGSIPNEIVSLTQLSESCVVGFIVVTIVSCVPCILTRLACHFSSTAVLSLQGNSLTGSIPNQFGSLTQLSESS